MYGLYVESPLRIFAAASGLKRPPRGMFISTIVNMSAATLFSAHAFGLSVFTRPAMPDRACEPTVNAEYDMKNAVAGCGAIESTVADIAYSASQSGRAPEASAFL